MTAIPSSDTQEFFSCDWGTTSFRLRRVRISDGAILAEVKEASGVRTLAASCPSHDPQAREQAFSQFLRDKWQFVRAPGKPRGTNPPMVISGMASSSVGWRELPHAKAPFKLDGSSTRFEAFDLDLGQAEKGRVFLISGIVTDQEMMRGEETEILGLFAHGQHEEVARDGLVVMPGTHSKHVRVRQGRIETWQTFMTGELYDVLAAHSLLRVSVESNLPLAGIQFEEDDEAKSAFLQGVRAAQDPGLMRSLFQVRTRTVLQGIKPSVNRWFLSGLLIGSEGVHLALAAVDISILLAAPGSLNAAYRLAMETLSPKARLSVVPSEEMAGASVRGHGVLLRYWRRSGLLC